MPQKCVGRWRSASDPNIGELTALLQTLAGRGLSEEEVKVGKEMSDGRREGKLDGENE